MIASQNTQTGGGGNLIPTTGNSVLDAIFSTANVAVQGVVNGYGLYATIKDRELARQIEKENARQNAMQSLPAGQADGVITLSQPEQIQKLFLFGGLSLLLIGGAYFLYKKA